MKLLCLQGQGFKVNNTFISEAKLLDQECRADQASHEADPSKLERDCSCAPAQNRSVTNVKP